MSELGQNATPVATTEATPLVQIKKSELTAMVNEGKKRNEIAAYYGLKEAQMAKVLKAAGLKIRKFHLPTFELVDDSVEETAQVMETPVTQEVLGKTSEVAEETTPVEATVEEVGSESQVSGTGWSRTSAE